MTQAVPGAPLTVREREIAGLVAEGLRDQQIATRLSISIRTVHAHLRATYVKTATGSRVRLANWLTQDRPDAVGQPASGGGPDASG
jgi:DNA-binding CsgD family transcriptional regulator